MSKNDEYDAYAVATVLINQLHKLQLLDIVTVSKS